MKRGETTVLGVRNGRIVVTAAERKRYTVRCDCGTEKVIDARNFYKTESCGCLLREVSRRPKKHGLTVGSKPPEFTVWNNMRRRCSEPTNISYRDYGAGQQHAHQRLRRGRRRAPDHRSGGAPSWRASRDDGCPTQPRLVARARRLDAT